MFYVLGQLSGPAQDTLEGFENATLFLRLGLPSKLIRHKNGAFSKTLFKQKKFEKAGFNSMVTLIRHEKGAFRKRSTNRRNLKRPAFIFVWTTNTLKTKISKKRWRHDNHMISLTQFSSNTNPKWPVIALFLNSSGVSRCFIVLEQLLNTLYKENLI